MSEKDISSADFFRWLQEKALKEKTDKNNDEFGPQPLYITIEKPPLKKQDEENTDTLIDFNIENEDTDNTIVYKF
jgi:hypothetical protein